MIRTRVVTSLAVMGLIAGIGSFSVSAQDPAAKKSAEKSTSTEKGKPSTSVAKEKADPSRRVPNYFGQIGLSNEQREDIYKIRKLHQEKVDALRKQIAEADAKSMAECEAVLNDTQKKLLENLRAGSPRGTAKPAEAAKTKN